MDFANRCKHETKNDVCTKCGMKVPTGYFERIDSGKSFSCTYFADVRCGHLECAAQEKP